MGTPMYQRKSPSRLRELLTIAVLRLLYPDRLIPASLDVDGIDLLQERLEAGANVITSLIPPRLGLSGVSQPSLGIEEGSRTVYNVASLLDQIGLEVATNQDYFQWICREKVSFSCGTLNYEAVT
jgi:methylornithine synthase